MQAQLTQEQYDRIWQVIIGEEPVGSLQTPEELHQFAWNYNWDDGEEAMRQVIDHPKCDKATALLIYWYSGPGYLYQYRTVDEVPVHGDWAGSDYEKVDYEFVTGLEQQYLSGGFQSSGIAFDPASDDGTNWTKEYRDVSRNRPIPDEMYKPVTGIELQRMNF